MVITDPAGAVSIITYSPSFQKPVVSYQTSLLSKSWKQVWNKLQLRDFSRLSYVPVLCRLHARDDLRSGIINFLLYSCSLVQRSDDGKQQTSGFDT
jgi:hypothetical protein